MVKQLFGSRKATPAVLDFIAVTWAGQRALRKGQEMEREKRKRDEVRGLDANRLEGDEDRDTGWEQ